MRRRLLTVLTAVTLVAAAGVPGSALADRVPGHPVSAHCHVTDGTFTTCPDGSSEWSDVTPSSFAASNSSVYADQADKLPGRGLPNGSPVDTFMLMYDECGRTVPLGPNEYFLVNFDTVEVEQGQHRLNRYTVHVFADGTIVFIENGVLQKDAQGASRVPQIAGQRGRAAFGRSPNCPFDHLTVEYEIELHAAGGDSYSEDPLFWGGTAPDPPPPCPEAAAHKAASPAAGGVCTPQPQPQKKFTPQQKELFRQYAIKAGLLGASATAIALLCLLAPDPTITKLCAIAAATTSGLSGLAAAIARLLSDDPPDPDFKQIPVPVTPRLPEQPITATDGVNQRTADAVNAYLDNAEQQLGLLRASKVAVDRAGGAFAAGDVFWETRQVIAIRQFASQLSTLIAAEPALRNEESAALQAQGLDLTVTEQNVRDMQAGALPATVATVVTNLGGDPADVTTEVRAADPAAAAGLGGGHFPAAVADAGLLSTLTALSAALGTSSGTSIRPGFDTGTVPANDDGSVGPVPLGFTANFFGVNRDTVFVNNNGNLTLDQPLSEFTPFGLVQTDRQIVAPFFADVDTRVGRVATFGTGTVDGHPAFGATWPGVACFDQIASVLNFFQVVLIDRADRGPGNFDIEFNYDSMQWETGTASGGDGNCRGGSAAHVGFSNGTGAPGTFFELPGSGVPGAFLDDNASTGLIRSSLNSSQRGRYVFPVTTAGVPVTTEDADLDGVPDDVDNCPRTANPDQADTNLTGIGDACETPQTRHNTAAFLQANLDASTSAEPTGLTVADEPGLDQRLIRIVAFRVQAGLTTDPRQLTRELVQSLVDSHLVAAGAADALVEEVVGAVTPKDTTAPVVQVQFPQPDGRNGWFRTTPVTGTVTVDDTGTGGSPIVTVACSGAAVGTVSGLGTAKATAPVTVTGDGTHAIRCTGTDGAGNTGTATATVKLDATAPAVTCRPRPSVLWPPNHRLVTVYVDVDVHDATSGRDGFTLTSVTSSEPDTGLGPDDRSGDIQDWNVGKPDTVGKLRAERAGDGPGREYRLTYVASDRAGNTTSCVAVVTVPHSHP